MKVTKERLELCKTDGDYFEDLFREKIISKQLRYKKATDKDDWYRHIDCYVNGFGVDVKGRRRLEEIWLEYTNVNGNKGWLRGEAMYIAMFIKELNAFSIYYREDLLRFIEENVKEETTYKDEYFKFYTRKRWGKKDMIVKVRYADIKHLERDLF